MGQGTSTHSLWRVGVAVLTVAIGELPREEALKAKEAGDGEKKEPQDPIAVRITQQINTSISLIKAHENFEGSAKSLRNWLGEGLSSIRNQARRQAGCRGVHVHPPFFSLTIACHFTSS